MVQAGSAAESVGLASSTAHTLGQSHSKPSWSAADFIVRIFFLGSVQTQGCCTRQSWQDTGCGSLLPEAEYCQFESHRSDTWTVVLCRLNMAMFWKSVRHTHEVWTTKEVVGLSQSFSDTETCVLGNMIKGSVDLYSGNYVPRYCESPKSDVQALRQPHNLFQHIFFNTALFRSLRSNVAIITFYCYFRLPRLQLNPHHAILRFWSFTWCGLWRFMSLGKGVEFRWRTSAHTQKQGSTLTWGCLQKSMCSDLCYSGCSTAVIVSPIVQFVPVQCAWSVP